MANYKRIWVVSYIDKQKKLETREIRNKFDLIELTNILRKNHVNYKTTEVKTKQTMEVY